MAIPRNRGIFLFNNIVFHLEGIMDIEWVRNWIRSVAKKLAADMSFEEWISGFEDRYSPEILKIMKEIWDSYRI